MLPVGRSEKQKAPARRAVTPAPSGRVGGGRGAQLLEVQRSAGNQAAVSLIGSGEVVQRRVPDIQRDYTDVPSDQQWVLDSKAGHKKRTREMQDIDRAVSDWQKVKSGSDLPAQLAALRAIRDRIYNWEVAKRRKYASEDASIRSTMVADLKKVVLAKIDEVSDAHAVELQPLADEYLKAANEHDIEETLAKGTELRTKHGDFFIKTLSAGLAAAKKDDKVTWGILFFCVPEGTIGSPAVNAMQLRMLGDYSWISSAMAKRIIEDFIVPNCVAGGFGQHIMQMLQIQPFRQALKAKAPAKMWQELSDSMPLLRITAATEQEVADQQIGDDEIDRLAEAVFYAFLGDLPKSKLIYSTNALNFKLDDFVLGSSDPAIGAPCMALSSVFRELFKMVTANPPAIIEGEDRSPMLTKPLASIGTSGILTRDTQFHGNVSVYGKAKGYQAINRVFFGDGHVWLEINGREYDPTLGITGPKGTVAKQVAMTFQADGKNKYKNGKTKVKKTDAVPPGGQRLLFTSSAEITGV